MDGDPIFAFDGAAALLRAWGGGLKPDPLLTVSEWADRYRKLSSRAAAEPGRYRTRRTPYMKEIMGALSPGRPAQRVVFMKAAQAQVRAPLAVDTPIPTPFGWSTMGDLAPGDLLYDEQGQVCGVTGVSEVMTPGATAARSCSTTASASPATASIAGRSGTSPTTSPSGRS